LSVRSEWKALVEGCSTCRWKARPTTNLVG